MSAHRNNDQRRHTRPRIVRVLLDEAGVNHEDNAIDCNRGFCDVGGQYNLAGALWCWLKDLGLHVAREVRVDRTNDQLGDLVA